MARLNELDIPATTLACSGCHGIRGEGKNEGGVTAGNLTWSNLIKPYGHTHPLDASMAPFRESALIRAVVNGVDSDGNELLVAMPRYKLSPEDMADIIAYLKRIDTDLDPGLTDTNITVGLVLPSSGGLADTGAAMKDILAAYFDNLNSRGGIFSRKIDLSVADSGAGGAPTANAAQNFAHKEQVFAFVGGLSADLILRSQHWREPRRSCSSVPRRSCRIWKIHRINTSSTCYPASRNRRWVS